MNNMNSLILSIILSLLLVGCNTQPVEVTVKMEQPRDTIIVTKEVRDTVFIGNIKNKSDLDNIALYAMRTKNRKLYFNTYNQYEYKHFGYSCGNSTIVERGGFRARRIIFTDTNLNGCVNCLKKITLPKKMLDTSLNDGKYGIVFDDTLRCSIVKNKMLIEAWDITKDGNVIEIDSNEFIQHSNNGIKIDGWK